MVCAACAGALAPHPAVGQPSPRAGTDARAVSAFARAPDGPGTASPAGSGQGGWTLDWIAPPDCPDLNAVRSSVEARLSPDPPAGSPFWAGAVARFEGERRWSLRLETRQAEGSWERVLVGPSCDAVARAAAVILALAIDPNARSSPAEPSVASFDLPPPATGSGRAGGAAAMPTPPEPARTPTAPAAAAPDGGVSIRAPRRAETVRTLVHAFGGLDAGTLPGPTVAAGAGVGLLAGRVRASLAAVYAFPASGTVPDEAERGGDLDLVAGSLGVCLRAVELRAFAVGPCARGEVGVVRGRGTGVENPRSASAPWYSVGAGAEATYEVGAAVALVARASAIAPLTRPRFFLERLGTVHEPAPATGRLELGAEVRFP